MRQMWEAQAASRGQQSPYNLASYQLAVLTNPFPRQGFVATQPHLGQATHPSNLLVLVTARSL